MQERKAVTLEEVLKRNSRERLKREKFPLDILDELPVLIQQGYEEISEDDIVRLQWHGLYHDKPKTGEFMMRVKVPNGILTPEKLRTIGQISRKFGQNYGEITTRQTIQLHGIRLEHLPEIFATLHGAGLHTTGACGDVVRNITGCPVAGISREEFFDVRPVIRELAEFLDGNPEYSALPRKHKITVAACPCQCNLPEIHCQAYVGVRRSKNGQEELGFAVRVGGGLSTVPRISQPLGVFVSPEGVLPLVRAILDEWKTDLTYRRSFIKARLKFMVDDLGPEELRRRVEARLGYRLEDLPEYPVPQQETAHLGVHEQRQDGLYYIGFPVFPGRISGEQMAAVADLVAAERGDIRLTRQQNLILTHIEKARVDGLVKAMAAIGITLESVVRGRSVACTGQPFCNFAVSETKLRLVDIVEHLEKKFGRLLDELQINLDGCPHACGQHWIGDIGLMGTTARDEEGNKIQAYDVILRGGRGRTAAIGRPLGRRIPAEQVKFALERLVGAYSQAKAGNGFDSFQAFCEQNSDEALQAIMEVAPPIRQHAPR